MVLIQFVVLGGICVGLGIVVGTRGKRGLGLYNREEIGWRTVF